MPESTLVKMPHCWKSHAMAHIYFNSLHAEEFFMLSSHLPIFFPQKNSFRKMIRVSTDWIQIRPGVLSGLIWVQTVFKNCQQMILEVKRVDLILTGFPQALEIMENM